MKTNWPVLRSGFMILTCLAVGTTVMPVRAQEAAGVMTTPTVISSVAILQSASQRASVRVEGEGRGAPPGAGLQRVKDLAEAAHFQLSHDGGAVVVLFNEASGASNRNATSNSTSNSS